MRAGAERAPQRAWVCADSFRHMIYNTLWTSNRLIKYILYKYISYCTSALLYSHCEAMAQTPKGELRYLPGFLPYALTLSFPHWRSEAGWLGILLL